MRNQRCSHEHLLEKLKPVLVGPYYERVRALLSIFTSVVTSHLHSHCHTSESQKRRVSTLCFSICLLLFPSAFPLTKQSLGPRSKSTFNTVSACLQLSHSFLSHWQNGGVSEPGLGWIDSSLAVSSLQLEVHVLSCTLIQAMEIRSLC